MKYSEILNNISLKISSLDNDKANNYFIYQRNLLGGLIKSLSIDLPMVLKYLGENNFKFLVRDYLLQKGISQANIFDVSLEFKNYLSQSYHIHEDDLVEYLAALDLLWSNNNEDNIELNLPAGLFEFWNSIESDLDTKDITINFDKTERYKLIIKGEEKSFIKLYDES